MSGAVKYPEASTVRAITEARSLLQALEKNHPKRSALLRLQLLEAQSDYRDTLIDEGEFRVRVTDVARAAEARSADSITYA